MKLSQAVCALLALLLLAACESATSAPSATPFIPEPTAFLTSAPSPTATSLPEPTPTLVRETPLDGSRIALVTRTFSPPESFSSNVVVLSEPRGTVQETLLAGAESPSWSPGGRQLLVSVKGAITLVDSSTWQSRILSFPAQGESDHLPQWSPDGRWISFVRAVGPKTSSLVYPGMWQELGLWTMKSDGSQVRRMTPDWQTNSSTMTPSWSPDSSTFAYPASRGNNSHEWRFVDAASGQPIPMELAADDTILWPNGQLAGQQILWAPQNASAIIVFDWQNGRCAHDVALTFFDAHLGRITKISNVPRSALLHWSVDGSELRFDAPANYDLSPGACNSIQAEPPRTFAVSRNGGTIRLVPPEGTATPTTGGAPTVRIDTHGVWLAAPGGSELSVMQFSTEFNLLNAFCRYCTPAIASSAHRSRTFFVAGRLSAPQSVHGALWSAGASTGDLERLSPDEDILDFAAYP